MKLGDYYFHDLGELEVERDSSGWPISLRPQDRFENPAGLRTHSYGDLEYCRFKIGGLPRGPGVYAFVSDGEVVYIGKAGLIAKRFMPGYRLISPRMCYEGGPQTTCRINALVLVEALSGRSIHVLVLETTAFEAVESELIQIYQPKWNRTGVCIGGYR